MAKDGPICPRKVSRTPIYACSVMILLYGVPAWGGNDVESGWLILPSGESLDAQARDSIVRVIHALEPYTALVCRAGPLLAIRRPVLTRRARATSTALVTAPGPWSPGRVLHGTLHDGRVVRTHARGHSPPLEVGRVKIQVVVTPPLAHIESACNFRGRWWGVFSCWSHRGGAAELRCVILRGIGRCHGEDPPVGATRP